MAKTVEEINQKIREGNVVVITAAEMKDIVEELGPEKAAKEVDVVTTGTFGAMCSSGAFFNFGHADPPIKMQRVWMNDVEAYTGIAAVDAYLGVTQLSESVEEYGGGHVIEELVKGREVELKATAYGTDCYPRKEIVTEVSLEDVNQAVMVNPRNAYQRYNAATNSSNKLLRTYMGTLLPNFGNVTFAGTGEISPLNNDPEYRTIGIGTRIFLCGAKGYVIGEGTQHAPPYGTLMVKGNLKEMKPEYMKAAYFPGYGATLFVGIGIPIPILDAEMAKFTAVRNSEIETKILDFGVARRDRPVVRKVTYEELISGRVEINGEEVRVSPLSSFYMAEKIMKELKRQIERGEFLLTAPVDRIPTKEVFKPMRQREVKVVKSVMVEAYTISPETAIEEAARIMMDKGINHIPVVEEGRLVGIITSWDIAKAVARNRKGAVKSIMTRNVIYTHPDEPVEVAARKMEQNNISALPVVDSRKRVLGIVTSEDLSKLIAR
ncbi:homocysteine biosynthesis protein [Archaeoglobus sp.]|uniref:homocysteine biosynthesis protein n=1 Tax=Archaeoglobus sp. TaxID=1872626 RepID=UPI0024AB3BE1|nr:homocysteine biosynthesis protein [Archaeoglobus sp.]MDI3497576.1 L-aspartate semialdehyde sulfurtransferase [Archaeoglobus sp.]